MKLALVTTHPIQYHAQWFRALAARPELDLEVFYCHRASPRDQAEAGFGVEFEWDVPLLDGYESRFLKNVAAEPSVGQFFGLDTPEIGPLIAANRYDAVLVNGWHYKSAWQAIRACWKNKVPLMVRGDSHLHTRRTLLKRLAKEAPYRWFLSKVDACLAAGKWSSEYFRHYGAPPDRIFLVPHAAHSVSEEDLQGAIRCRPTWRAQWGFRPNETIFVFSGKFIEEKRPMDFVRAIDIARKRFPNINGLMAGDGPLKEQCLSLARSLGAPIRFAGFLNQSEIAKAYVVADALVLPSEGETWGMVVNEAMSWGRPALVSDQVGCGPDLVSHGKTGFVFPMGHVEALAAQLAECASRQDGLAAMREKARERIAGYSVNAAVEGVLQALSRVGVEA